MPGADLMEVSAAGRAALGGPSGDMGTDRDAPDSRLDALTTLILDTPAEAAPKLRTAVAGFLDDQPAEAWLHPAPWCRTRRLPCGTTTPGTRRAPGTWRWPALRGRWLKLVTSINVRRVVALFGGDVDAARSLGVTEDVVKQATGTRRASYGDLFVFAYEGLIDRASPLIAATAAEGLSRGRASAATSRTEAATVLNLGLGRYAEAAEAAVRAGEGDLGPFTSRRCCPTSLEAAARSGRPDLAADALDRLRAATAGCDTDWAGGHRGAHPSTPGRRRRVRGRGSSRPSSGSPGPGWRGARPAQLLYGEWLRARAAASRLAPNSGAHTTRSTTWGSRASRSEGRHELNATGEKVRRRDVDTLDQLAPQEEHMARLARDGRSNPEIGAELFQLAGLWSGTCGKCSEPGSPPGASCPWPCRHVGRRSEVSAALNPKSESRPGRIGRGGSACSTVKGRRDG